MQINEYVLHTFSDLWGSKPISSGNAAVFTHRISVFEELVMKLTVTTVSSLSKDYGLCSIYLRDKRFAPGNFGIYTDYGAQTFGWSYNDIKSMFPDIFTTDTFDLIMRTKDRENVVPYALGRLEFAQSKEEFFKLLWKFMLAFKNELTKVEEERPAMFRAAKRHRIKEAQFLENYIRFIHNLEAMEKML
jgi:hypothetical protein